MNEDETLGEKVKTLFREHGDHYSISTDGARHEYHRNNRLG